MALDTSHDLQSIGNYDLVEKIAEGGMGTVYRGRHRLSGQIVAVKVLPSHLGANVVHLKRFEQEYAAAKQLDHPNIVKALDFGREADTHFLVMEFVEGESLGQKLEREGKLAEADAVALISQVAKGLHKAHKQGLVHRDVKPDNILLTPDGQVKLTDLGLVKEIDTDLNLTKTGRGLGTPHFMAPEQFRNAKNADARCDIYSLAATLYMTVTGILPFDSCGPVDAWMKKIRNEIAPPRKMVPEISERVDWAICRSMSAEPSQRAGSCMEFIEDLTGHGTRPLEPLLAAIEEKLNFWYLVYTDDEGVVHLVKGTVEGIRQMLRENLIGDASNIRVSRLSTGPFDSVRNHPEFRDLVVETPYTGKSSQTALKKNGRGPILTPRPMETTLPAGTPIQDPALKNTPKEIDLVPRSTAAETVTAKSIVPHIPLVRRRRQGEWSQWMLLLAIAAVTGIASYFLMPLLLPVRRH